MPQIISDGGMKIVTARVYVTMASLHAKLINGTLVLQANVIAAVN